jgi:antitoxin component YwqK of YwqJK toxin-antitoxin module
MTQFSSFVRKYPSEEGYVFASCSREWIIVLLKLGNTKTNEERSNVINPMFAKFRADKLLVVDIIHKVFPNNTINETTNRNVFGSIYESYKKGEIIEVQNFDNDLENIDGNGIYYFKSLDAARCYQNSFHHEGICRKYDDNGQKMKEFLLGSGRYHGQYKEWYGNEQLKIECTYNDGQENGSYKEWYESGQRKEECTFCDGRRVGAGKTWHECGQLKRECTFKDNLRNELYREWFESGNPKIECKYELNLLNGKYNEWFESGQIKVECTYKDNKLNDLYKEWDENGQLKAEYIYNDGEREGIYKVLDKINYTYVGIGSLILATGLYFKYKS